MAKLIKVNGETATFTLPRKSGGRERLTAMQEAVGGYIEYVYINRGRDVLVVNEEGRLIGLPINPAASLLAGQAIVGDALLLAAREAS